MAAAPRTARSPLAPGLPLTVDPAWHLARRATHAATSAQVAAIRKVGTTRWVDAQLAPGRIDDRATERFVAARFPVTTKDMPGIRAYTGNKPWEAQPALARATVWRQLTTKRPLLERVVEMWHDHLHIALGDDKVAGWLCVYDREVIRPRALGRFADLLYAATTHPAMLRYFDNDGSMAQYPVENLAREFLELHTVGTGAFRERDVKDLAKLLTGFSSDWNTGAFVYRPHRARCRPRDRRRGAAGERLPLSRAGRVAQAHRAARRAPGHRATDRHASGHPVRLRRAAAVAHLAADLRLPGQRHPHRAGHAHAAAQPGVRRRHRA